MSTYPASRSSAVSAVLGAAVVVIWPSKAALAATVVTGASIQARANGSVRLVIVFTGGVPRYRVVGNGSAFSFPVTGFYIIVTPHIVTKGM